VTGPVPAFPDAELVAINWLRTNGFRAGASVPQSPARPNLVVTRTGGSPAVKWAVDLAALQVDVWGQTKQQARDTAADALACLYAMPGQAGQDEDAFVSDVDVTLGLSWQPDDAQNPPIPRYLFAIAVTLRPLRKESP
jgi:hypothetical protein